MIAVVLYIALILALLCLGGILVNRMNGKNTVDKKQRLLAGDVFYLRDFPLCFYRFVSAGNTASPENGFLQEKESAFSETFSDCYKVRNLDQDGFEFYNPTITKWRGHIDFDEVVFQKGGQLT